MTMEEGQDDERRRRHSKPVADKAVAGWGSALVAGFIAAAVIGNVLSLRRRLANVHKASTQGNRSRPGANSRQGTNPQGHGSGSQQYRKSEQQQTWSHFKQDEAESKRMWEEHMEEMERIRRRQEAFDRERMRTKRNYESWQERHGDKWEWKWHGNKWEWQGEAERRRAAEGRNDWWRDAQGQKSKSRKDSPPSVSTAEHYDVLGLDVSRSPPYTEAEIKAAFRAKALELHPDQNQSNKEEAEAKFRHVMDAYNALRSKPS
ncbi:hypothetical protein MPTK1_1g14490 [Marchantia polymorpha subsp. ruderalis]|uniref:J domain-containing protein n=2 Tax=Marchantia polymorpha TaxID=3197 RepID=A0AAF6AQ51_MARPO|nr:hypothetical protein MARPO_0153s0040 [Marchantia polymorpha]BBM98571.1 hypothetical protein Mp_1g14490 [Marchantia polymorpha subsp. ruderalis]|eukprot:PTQ28878.1 hypothetical protein MARPO_0153s0040 [Marchantia polymorpha]